MINGTAHNSSVPTHPIRPVAASGETGSESKQPDTRRALVPAGERRDLPRRSSPTGERQLPQSARLGASTMASLHAIGSYQPRGLRAETSERRRYSEAYSHASRSQPGPSHNMEKRA